MQRGKSFEESLPSRSVLIFALSYYTAAISLIFVRGARRIHECSCCSKAGGCFQAPVLRHLQASRLGAHTFLSRCLPRVCTAISIEHIRARSSCSIDSRTCVVVIVLCREWQLRAFLSQCKFRDILLVSANIVLCIYNALRTMERSSNFRRRLV